MEYQIDVRFTDFPVHQKITHGATSMIYSAETSSGNQVIIKRYSERTVRDFPLSFQREVDILMQCQHPSIVRILGYSDIDKFIILEKLSCDLNNLISINNVKLDHTSELIILIGIAAGMKYLHQHQIVFRDLKPSNILIDTTTFYPKLCDFGYSKQQFSIEEAESSHCLGTTIYFSPEVMRDNKDYPARDVYSFSMVIYFLLLKKEPFGELQKLPFFGFIERICDGVRPEIPTNKVPIFFENLMKRCWDANYEIRPTFQDIFDELIEFARNCFEVDQNRLSAYLEKFVFLESTIM
ncbi:hypothetical protein TRFO_30051 [Tritrichomonas foetus]|uniref:Protein kinase domain-containing protein n=1 Tax=Tritrichomonas foetus TaxID=1144522 RepID=A0A1J4JUB5_9EUKA|nr:hypothetical protein TRFO_30051 [Tritrichomonas foetus]|eukprot:OHT02743.1 hypothetical protein TRFO_30051 [Tritrichomonas foetus]